MKFVYPLCVLALVWSACQPPVQEPKETPTGNFDWQGHRGARGLAPENTIPAFLKALEFPVRTLELDVVITKDRQVIVSHEPWMSPTICNPPESLEPSEEEQAFKIYEMTYAKLAAFDCGKPNPAFPEQEPVKVRKPLLGDAIAAAEKYCRQNNRVLPFYNIEIKSKPHWDSVFTPQPDDFAQLVLKVIEEQEVGARTCIQSFDPRSLEAVHLQNPEMATAYLVDDQLTVEQKLAQLSFVPEIYSPNHRLVNRELVEVVHQKGMKIIPWTVNEVSRMQELIALGVDGIITDYPNRIPLPEKASD